MSTISGNEQIDWIQCSAWNGDLWRVSIVSETDNVYIGFQCGGGGELSYKSDRDARRLALGCKLQILVSLRVFGMKSYYICPSRYRLVLCVKKFTKNALTLTRQKSTLGFSLSHTHIGLPALGV